MKKNHMCETQQTKEATWDKKWVRSVQVDKGKLLELEANFKAFTVAQEKRGMVGGS